MVFLEKDTLRNILLTIGINEKRPINLSYSAHREISFRRRSVFGSHINNQHFIHEDVCKYVSKYFKGSKEKYAVSHVFLLHLVSS